MQNCRKCNTPLTQKDIIDQEKEGSYICRGSLYDELSDIPTQWRDEAEYSEIINSTTYRCSNKNCSVENIIE